MDHIARIEQEPPVAPSSFTPKHPIRREQPNKQQREREELGVSPFGKWRETWQSTSELRKSRNEITKRALRGEQMQNGTGGDLGHSLSADARSRATRDKYLPCHYFDYIGGTSTGGYVSSRQGQSHPLNSSRLISIMLSRLRMSVDEAIEEYEHLAGFIFGHPRIFSIRGPIPFPRDKYSSKRVVDVVQQVVLSRLCGKDPSMGQDLFASHERMCKT
jgi:hypothetical protein